jgi:hypothetical protein
VTEVFNTQSNWWTSQGWWTCGRCQATVMGNHTHDEPYYVQSDPSLGRIAVALERIADALEKQGR